MVKYRLRGTKGDNMHTLTKILGSLICSAALMSGLGLQASALEKLDISCTDDEVCRITETMLPFQVLARPFSAILTEPDESADTKADNISAFKPLYVFQRMDVDLSDPTDPKGWYQVGASERQPIGWMAARDVLEWRQPMIVTYTPKTAGDDGRNPVIGFSSLDSLQAIVESEDYVAQAETRFEALQSGETVENVVTAEPDDAFVNFEEQFYIWPVLDWEMLEDYFDEPVRYLQLSTAVPKSRATAPEEYTVESEGRMAEVAGVAATESAGRMAEDGLTIDLVFVMDLTSSMEPFIGYTLETLERIRLKLEQEGSVDRVRFGFVGYRDDAEAMPGLEYTAKNYTPNLLSSEEFAALLDGEVKVTNASSRDYQEEVYAGVQEALDTNWSEAANSVKILVLVGDASSHPVGHDQNTTGLDAAGLRALIDQQDIKVITLHLRDPANSADWATATAQFAALSMNTADSDADVIPVPADDEAAYTEAAQIIGEVIAGLTGRAPDLTKEDIDRIASGEVEEVLGTTAAATEAGAIAESVAGRVAAGAFMNVVGKGYEAERDVMFWVSDRDLADPTTVALEARLMMTRKQLNDLIIALEQVRDALAEVKVTKAGFMETLQSIVAGTAAGAEVDFKSAERISGTRLVPRFIEYLPYRSKIMSMSDDTIAALTPDEFDRLHQELDGLITLYKTISETDTAWHQLNDEDGSLSEVTALRLTNLP